MLSWSISSCCLAQITRLRLIPSVEPALRVAGDRFPLILVTGMFPDHRRSVMYRLFVLGRHHQGRNTECSQLRLQRHPSTPGKHIRYMFLIVHGQVALAFVHPYHWLVVTTLSCQISIALDVDGLCHHSIEKDEGISYSACIEEHSHPRSLPGLSLRVPRIIMTT